MIQHRPIKDEFNRPSESDLQKRFPQPEAREQAREEIDKAEAKIEQLEAARDRKLDANQDRPGMHLTPDNADQQVKYREARQEARRDYQEKTEQVLKDRDKVLQQIEDRQKGRKDQDTDKGADKPHDEAVKDEPEHSPPAHSAPDEEATIAPAKGQDGPPEQATSQRDRTAEERQASIDARRAAQEQRDRDDPGREI